MLAIVKLFEFIATLWSQCFTVVGIGSVEFIAESWVRQILAYHMLRQMLLYDISGLV